MEKGIGILLTLESFFFRRKRYRHELAMYHIRSFLLLLFLKFNILFGTLVGNLCPYFTFLLLVSFLSVFII